MSSQVKAYGVYDHLINQIVDNYYVHILNLIRPFLFFNHKLCRLISFHRLVKRTSKSGKPYIRKRVFDEKMLEIKNVKEILELMRKYKVFDINMTCNCYTNPSIAAKISREKCTYLTNLNGYQIYERFNCNKCLDKKCKRNVLLHHSYLYIDLDLKIEEAQLNDLYIKIREIEDDLKIKTIIKISSHQGLHLLLPLSTVKINQNITSPLERTLYQYSFGIAMKKIIEERLNIVRVDPWNFIDLNQSVRTPFSLHYEYLIPSIPLTDENFEENIRKIKEIISEASYKLKISLARDLVTSNEWNFKVEHDNTKFIKNCLENLKHEAIKKVLRIKIIKRKQKAPNWFRRIVEKKVKISKEDIQKMKEYFKSLGKSDTEAEHIIRKIIEIKDIL